MHLKNSLFVVVFYVLAPNMSLNIACKWGVAMVKNSERFSWRMGSPKVEISPFFTIISMNILIFDLML